MLATALAAGALVSADNESVALTDLLQNQDRFHSKPVKVLGAVADFKQKTSRAGNKYVVFKLTESEKKVNVYRRGWLEQPLKDGAKVQVYGVYQKEKRVGAMVFKNEIDCTPVKGKEFGVTVVPAK